MEFSQIAILLVVAGGFGIVSKLLRQPLLIGYLFAGIALGLFGFSQDLDVYSGLGQIGVALLLFLLGLEMKIQELPSIGKVALFTGLGQILVTSTVGFLLARILGFETLPSVYIAVALTFSSTIIMVKLLSEKNDLGSLYGKIAVGFLLVQDFVAVVILMFLASLGMGGSSALQYVFVGAKAIGLFIVIWILSKKAIPYLIEKFISTSSELLFIVSIAWALGLAAFVAGPLGFTPEIGGFLAGLALSNLPEHLQIATRTRPLRDFFLTIFFLMLGASLVVGVNVIPLIPAALIFSIFVLVGNPVIVMIIMGLLGYKRRTSFLSGLTVAQISEFSLIIVAMGLALGHLTNSELGLMVLVGVITMTTSTYLIIGADKIYKKIHPLLRIFEKKITKEAVIIDSVNFNNHIVVIGADQTGRQIVNFLKRKGVEYVVVDFNPRIYKRLSAEKTPVIFGDINDPEILEAAKVSRAKMVISSIPSLLDNLTLLEYTRLLKRRPTSIITASTRSEAYKLYEARATYVIVPEVVAGEHVRSLLKTYGTNKKRLTKIGKSHFDRLLKMY